MGQREFVIELIGSQINNGVNNFDIVVSYFDAESNSYTSTEIINVELIDVTFGQRIKLLFNRLGRIIENLF